MKARELGHRDVFTIAPEASVTEVARELRRRHVGMLVVVAEGRPQRVPLGIITDRDLVVGVMAEGPDIIPKLTAGDLVRRKPITAREDADVSEVLASMRENGIRRMVILDAKGELSGVIAYEDIIDHLAVQLGDLAKLLLTERDNERRLRRADPSRSKDEWR